MVETPIEWVGDRQAAPAGRRSGLAIALGAVVALALAAVVFVVADDPPERAGVQLGPLGSAATIGSAAGRAWSPLVPVDGEQRAGFPLPMVSVADDGVCFGFGRVDFRPPPRPTLARCVSAEDVPSLPATGMTTLVRIQNGFDYWHLVQFGEPVRELTVELTDGSALTGDRVHISDRLAALRIPLDAPLEQMSWGPLRNRIVCAPAADAAMSGRFCAR